MVDKVAARWCQWSKALTYSMHGEHSVSWRDLVCGLWRCVYTKCTCMPQCQDALRTMGATCLLLWHVALVAWVANGCSHPAGSAIPYVAPVKVLAWALFLRLRFVCVWGGGE